MEKKLGKKGQKLWYNTSTSNMMYTPIKILEDNVNF